MLAEADSVWATLVQFGLNCDPRPFNTACHAATIFWLQQLHDLKQPLVKARTTVSDCLPSAAQ